MRSRVESTIIRSQIRHAFSSAAIKDLETSKIAVTTMSTSIHSLLLLISSLLLLTTTFAQPMVRIYGPFDAIEDKSLQILCFTSSAGEAANLILRENATPLEGVQRTEINATFIAFTFNVTRTDNGRQIQCDASGVMSQLQTIVVYYIDDYIFRMGPSLTLGEGRNASVSYTIEANPITNHILVRTDGRPVSSRITVSNTSIDYTGVNRNDAGEYRLSTTNEAGTAMTTFNLTVQYGATFDVATSSNLQCNPESPLHYTCTAPLGQTVYIDCQYDASPSGTLSVTFDQAPISEINNVQLSGTRISIERATESNYGTYQCALTNNVTGMDTTNSVSVILNKGSTVSSFTPIMVIMAALLLILEL